MSEPYIEYNSNNSGGSWWLEDADWKALEEAGWVVHWIEFVERDYGKMIESGRRYETPLSPAKAGPRPGLRGRTDQVIAVANSYDEALVLADEHGRYLSDALAVSAAKSGDDPQALVDEWSSITGEDPGEEGCNCCGPPHSFEFHDANGDTHYAETERISTFKGFSLTEKAPHE